MMPRRYLVQSRRSAATSAALSRPSIPALSPSRPVSPAVLGIVVGIILVLLFAVGTGMARGASTAPGRTSNATKSIVVVSEGDTLWAIARAAHHGGDVRRFVSRIAQVNNLKGPILEPGIVLILPAP